MRSGGEIQADLRKFVRRWRSYAGSERGEAQTYLNELIACYGVDRKEVGALFEDSHTATGIMDMYWPGVCIFEMKAPSKADKLSEFRKQALDYWHSSDDAALNRAAPPYVVLCAFERFEIWEPGRFPSAPRADFVLDELPDNYEKLLFLAGTDQEPLFGPSYKELTTEAASVIADLYHALLDRNAAAPETLRSFALQIVWCLFAENLGMIEGRPVRRIVENLLQESNPNSFMALGALFDVLNDPTNYGRHGILQGTRYVNGSLFEKPAKVYLEKDELGRLAKAAEYEWRKVDPTIFGSLMEDILGHDRRWELGAHYTHEVDIMKIVRPTILEPWRELIEAASTVGDLRQVLDDLCQFRVLDPACGCGNFLYVAYREMRSLEHELKQQISEAARNAGVPAPNEAELPYYPLKNLYGIDIEPTAVLIARVTLWMGQRQMIDYFGPAEEALPLVNLSGIKADDALKSAWPKCDCVIGNPPFMGASSVRRSHGAAYVDWLKKQFNAGVKDYCVYWFRKTNDYLLPGQRAGLVGTNSISQNLGRKASLDYIADHGGVITDAISTQKWPGDAKVHVSIVNWIKNPSSLPTSYFLDGIAVSGIAADLRTPEKSATSAVPLPGNFGKAFEGPSPKAKGFVIKEDEAERLLARKEANYKKVVRPYLDSADVAHDPSQAPCRWAIDFALMPLEEAMRYPAALDILRVRAKPEREANNRKAYRRNWWQFAEPRRGMRQALAGHRRYIAMGAHGKRLLFTWQDPWTLASNATKVFAFEDDYSMGVLCSHAHDAWSKRKVSTFKADPRYTHTSSFETFPWPYPIFDEYREIVATSASRLIRRRHEICTQEEIGLTTLYNRVDEGAYTDLLKLQTELDAAVIDAYGWPRSMATDDDGIVRTLLDLNQRIAAGELEYDPFGTLAADEQGTLFSSE